MTPQLWRLLGANAPVFVDTVNRTVADSMVYGYLVAQQRGQVPTEPDFVALLVCHAVPRMGQLLNAMFQAIGGAARITSVFCHGRPEVDHNSNRCELGDVLFAFIHRDAAGREYRNSLLLQAKMSSTPQLTLGTNELHQLGLYTNWGKFTYTRTSGLSGQTRNVTPSSAHSGAQYMLIDNTGPGNPNSGVNWSPRTYPMGTAPAQLQLAIVSSLGKSLLGLLWGANGRQFLDEPNAIANWDQVIWDLIRRGQQKAFNQRRVRVLAQPRGVDVILRYALDNSFTQSGDVGVGRVFADLHEGMEPPGQLTSGDGGEGEEGGVSIIVVESSEGEGRN